MTIVVSTVVPDLPVTVMVYAPAVVPGMVVWPPPPPDPPHAIRPPAAVSKSSSIISIARHLRRRDGMPNRRMHANAAPPVVYHGTPRSFGEVRALVVGAVVLIVKVAVAVDVPETLTGEVAPKAKVGGFTAPAGLEARAAESTTLPVKPLLGGVMVMVEVLAVVAPAVTETDEPLIAKLGDATCTVLEPELL